MVTQEINQLVERQLQAVDLGEMELLEEMRTGVMHLLIQMVLEEEVAVPVRQEVEWEFLLVATVQWEKLQ
jgi:hypothetical protein